MRKELGKIDYQSGAGGFLKPPNHPEHTLSVTSLRGDRFCMSLSYAVDAEWLDNATRSQALAFLNNWKAPALRLPKTKAWVAQVLGYFANCYQSESGSWDAVDLVVSPGLDPVQPRNQEKHAGVHFIRKFYPEFYLTQAILDTAKWGD